MKDKPKIKSRRSIRLKDYNYSDEGTYFVTICTKGHKCIFGDVMDGGIRLNEYGKIAEACLLDIKNHIDKIELDSFVIMPNHIHGIICIKYDTNLGARHAVPLQDASKRESFGRPISSPLSTVIRSFKSAVSRQINKIENTSGKTIWQRNYYERVIRDEDELDRIREYISENPMKWEFDPENPDALRVESEKPWES
jgi:REP element-mobilizing transposase RayT